ncbi:MAG: AEC family transporter [Synergistaceae bacterium]|jgi:predicted permease|nr:AEC family transporter [Synergistaceae bacterium]
MQAVLTVVPIFLLVGLGASLKYLGFVSPQTLKENNFILYWFAMPATLLRGILSADVGALQSSSFPVAVWLPYLVTIVIVWLTGRHGETRQRFATLTLSAVRGNHFYVGIPVIHLAMGQSGVEAGTLILAFSLVLMQLLSIGSGQLALLGKPSWETAGATLARLLKNPLFLSCLCGLSLTFAGLNHLPAWTNSTLGILADISTGMALLTLGAGLHFENVLRMILSVWKIVLFKLVVHPVVTGLVFFAFGLSTQMIQAGVLLSAMPVAVNSAILAQEMGMDNEYCARGIAITTLCSMLSLPIWINILGLV